MKIIDWFKEKSNLINENSKIKKSKKDIETKYNEMLEDMNEISKKYTNLLEQKSEKFDLYLKYQNQCETLMNDKRELKKQIAESTELINSLQEVINEQNVKKEKLERKVKRLEKTNEKSK